MLLSLRWSRAGVRGRSVLRRIQQDGRDQALSRDRERRHGSTTDLEGNVQCLLTLEYSLRNQPVPLCLLVTDPLLCGHRVSAIWS